jgi:hypothetical protein
LNLLLVALALAAAEPARVIVVSFDGAGYATAQHLLAEGKLPSFERMVREGAWSDGMVTSFPTKTAAAHALLFTGQHGHASGITANSVLRFPPSAGSRLETLNGFFSESLRAEPVWARAAARGLETWVFHAPQVYLVRCPTNVVYGYSGATSAERGLVPAVAVPKRVRLIAVGSPGIVKFSTIPTTRRQCIARNRRERARCLRRAIEAGRRRIFLGAHRGEPRGEEHVVLFTALHALSRRVELHPLSERDL